MKLAWMDGTAADGSEKITKLVEETMQKEGIEYKHLKLNEMNIQPCRNCGGCNVKTPGRCVEKDETGELIKAVVNTDSFLVLTHISFGSYSSVVKKAMDKLSLTGLPVFICHEGRLQHPHRYAVDESIPKYVIAIVDGNSSLQKESFKQLIAANGRIMMSDIRLLFVEQEENTLEIRNKLTKFLRGGKDEKDIAY